MKKKLKEIVLLGFIICLAMCVMIACAPANAEQKSETETAQSEIKTDISQSQASEAAEGIREQAEYTLSAAELVYVYAYPDMLKAYGSEVEAMDAETYFLRFAKMIQEDDTLVPSDEEVLSAIDSLAIDIESGTFNIESFSAGMSEEIGAVPAAMQQKIKNYDSASQGENKYMEAAHAALNQG